MKKIFFLGVLLVATAVFAAGETGLAVLKVGVGARATAMGEAFTATANDATGLYWNPASSAWIHRRQVHFSHNSWIQGINHNVAALTLPSKIGSFGIGLLLNNIDGFERRMIASEEPTGTFSAHDFSFSLNYARQLRPSLSVGLNLKFINEKIYIEDASGYMIDLGARYLTPVNGLFIAGALQNLGFTTKMLHEKIRLPQTLRLGAAYEVPFSWLKDRVLLAADYVGIFNESSHVNVGIEVTPVDALALRTGYQTGFEDQGISSGFGLHVNWLDIDYAYLPFGRDLGDSHRFSLTTTF
ncbi:PorV/PorQ family protein [candidate division KSB1 bacterium]|nr:PorV/PorQ family protein [candidate division KSB1 bacterium]